MRTGLGRRLMAREREGEGMNRFEVGKQYIIKGADGKPVGVVGVERRGTLYDIKNEGMDVVAVRVKVENKIRNAMIVPSRCENGDERITFSIGVAKFYTVSVTDLLF